MRKADQKRVRAGMMLHVKKRYWAVLETKLVRVDHVCITPHNLGFVSDYSFHVTRSEDGTTLHDVAAHFFGEIA